MEKHEIIVRVLDLFNYAQAVRNQLQQLDDAIERLKMDLEEEGA